MAHFADSGTAKVRFEHALGKHLGMLGIVLVTALAASGCGAAPDAKGATEEGSAPLVLTPIAPIFTCATGYQFQYWGEAAYTPQGTLFYPNTVIYDPKGDYNLTPNDFRQLAVAGNCWDGNHLGGWSAHNAIVRTALGELVREGSAIPRPMFPDEVIGVGLCDGGATSKYGVDISGKWCSEFASWVYNHSAGVRNFESWGISTVDDFRVLFQSVARNSAALLDRSQFGVTQLYPGDYLAFVNSDGSHWGHSGILLGVSADFKWAWSIEGSNRYYDANGEHRCVTMKRWTLSTFANWQYLLNGNLDGMGRVKYLFSTPY